MPIAFNRLPRGLYRFGIPTLCHDTWSASERSLRESDIFCPLFIYSREGIPQSHHPRPATRSQGDRGDQIQIAEAYSVYETICRMSDLFTLTLRYRYGKT